MRNAPPHAMSSPVALPAPPSNSSSLSTPCLVCGILAFPSCLATALPAIILGHLARGQGDRSNKTLWGLILGYLSIAIIPVVAFLAGLVVPLFLKQQERSERTLCLMHAREIGMMLDAYAQTQGRYPADLRDLERAGYTPSLDSMIALRKRHVGDWLYFPNTPPQPPGAPLLVSPPIGRRIIVLRNDLSATQEDASFDLPLDESVQRIPAPTKR